MTHTYKPIPSDIVAAYRAGAPDANGQLPERIVTPSPGAPCRHCLKFIPVGAPMLILAHRPFDRLQPYAECGPIFLCAEACQPHEGGAVPEIFADTAMLVRGYGANERIVYGTGQVAPAGALNETCDAILQDPDVAFLHIRSASNNCFQARVERSG